MNTSLHAHLAGMGQSGQPLTGAQIGHAAVGTALTTAAAIVAPMGPVGAIAAGVMAMAAAIQNFFFQPDYNKLATSAIVTKAEALLQQNLNAWIALQPSEKTPATQQAATKFRYGLGPGPAGMWKRSVRECRPKLHGRPTSRRVSLSGIARGGL